VVYRDFFMTPEQKRKFYRDGYLIFRDIVPRDKVLKAAQTLYEDLSGIWSQSMQLGRRMSSEDNPAPEQLQSSWLEAVKKGLRTGVHPAILDLAAPESDLMQSIEEALGQPIQSGLRGAQLATLFPAQTVDHITECGYPTKEIPFYGWHGHLDGLWNGSAGVHQRTDRPMTREERDAWSGENGRNGVRRSYPSLNSNILNFTALLGIPLSDQMQEGCGNVGLLRGAHHHFERFFQQQKALGGPFGPDGPNWPRIHEEAPNRSGLRHYPDEIRNAYESTAVKTADGHIWPKPDLIKVQPGDAVLVMHGVPHGATRNESFHPRFMAYFRFVAESRSKDFMNIDTDSLTDCWHEWYGMRETVQEMRSEEAQG